MGARNARRYLEIAPVVQRQPTRLRRHRQAASLPVLFGALSPNGVTNIRWRESWKVYLFPVPKMGRSIEPRPMRVVHHRDDRTSCTTWTRFDNASETAEFRRSTRKKMSHTSAVDSPLPRRDTRADHGTQTLISGDPGALKNSREGGAEAHPYATHTNEKLMFGIIKYLYSI